MLLLTLHNADAGSFELVDGRSHELCRVYNENLKSFPDLSETTAEWPLNPELTKLRKARWEKVDPRQHLDVIKTLYFWHYSPGSQTEVLTADQIWDRESGTVLHDIADGSGRLERARIDFDNDGRVDTVYRYFHPLRRFEIPNWNTLQTSGYWYIYFDDKDNRVAETFRGYSRSSQLLYDSFLFDGRFYLIGWLGQELHIFELHALPTLHELALYPVCRFRFMR